MESKELKTKKKVQEKQSKSPETNGIEKAKFYNFKLKFGPNTIEHGLDYTPKNWVVVNKDSKSSVFLLNSDNKNITFMARLNCNITMLIW